MANFYIQQILWFLYSRDHRLEIIEKLSLLPCKGKKSLIKIKYPFKQIPTITPRKIPLKKWKTQSTPWLRAHKFADIYDKLEEQPYIQEIIREQLVDSDLKYQAKKNYNSIIKELKAVFDFKEGVHDRELSKKKIFDWYDIVRWSIKHQKYYEKRCQYLKRFTDRETKETRNRAYDCYRYRRYYNTKPIPMTSAIRNRMNIYGII